MQLYESKLYEMLLSPIFYLSIFYLSIYLSICLSMFFLSIYLSIYLVDILTGWTGPLSLAVFVPGIELAIAKRYISFLTKCFPNIDNQVLFDCVLQ